MTDHERKAEDHAEQAGGYMTAAKDQLVEGDGPDTDEEMAEFVTDVVFAGVEALLSISHRLAHIAEVLDR